MVKKKEVVVIERRGLLLKILELKVFGELQLQERGIFEKRIRLEPDVAKGYHCQNKINLYHP
jgi:hypothetical protein